MSPTVRAKPAASALDGVQGRPLKRKAAAAAAGLPAAATSGCFLEQAVGWPVSCGPFNGFQNPCGPSPPAWLFGTFLAQLKLASQRHLAQQKEPVPPAMGYPAVMPGASAAPAVAFMPPMPMGFGMMPPPFFAPMMGMPLPAPIPEWAMAQVSAEVATSAPQQQCVPQPAAAAVASTSKDKAAAPDCEFAEFVNSFLECPGEECAGDGHCLESASELDLQSLASGSLTDYSSGAQSLLSSDFLQLTPTRGQVQGLSPFDSARGGATTSRKMREILTSASDLLDMLADGGEW